MSSSENQIGCPLFVQAYFIDNVLTRKYTGPSKNNTGIPKKGLSSMSCLSCVQEIPFHIFLSCKAKRIQCTLCIKGANRNSYCKLLTKQKDLWRKCNTTQHNTTQHSTTQHNTTHLKQFFLKLVSQKQSSENI